MMTADYMTATDRNALLEDFTAELVSAAYPIALQHGKTGSWVDLELDLWRSLAGAVQKWHHEHSRRQADLITIDAAAWRRRYPRADLALLANSAPTLFQEPSDPASFGSHAPPIRSHLNFENRDNL
jgi:hypothetical protein